MVGVPMLRHEKTLCSNPKLFVLKPVSQRLSNTECAFVTRCFSRGALLDQLQMHVVGGRVVAELGDVAPARLPPTYASPVSRRPNFSVLVSAPFLNVWTFLSSMAVTSSRLPPGIWFVDAKAGAGAWEVPLRRAALRDAVTLWHVSPRTCRAVSEPFSILCRTVRNDSSHGRLRRSAER